MCPSPHYQNNAPTAVRFLTGRVAVVQWQGYWFTISQVRWGRFRRWLHQRIYRHSCPPVVVAFETAVFLSRHDGRFNPQKPLHTSFQKNRNEARDAMTQLARQLAEGRMTFQSFFQR